MKRILVVEDNAELAFGLQNNLEIEGYEVILAADGSSGLAEASRHRPDLILLDLMLPERDGYRVLKDLRERGLAMPVIVLTARGEESDKVRALKLGADDYVTKPFGLLELLARVEAHLRRTAAPAPGLELRQFGDVRVDPGGRLVTKGGRVVELAPREYDLLVELLSRPNTVVSRLELMRKVWGYSDAVVTRTIDTHIAELRKKLEDDPGTPRHILTVRKIGYRLQI